MTREDIMELQARALDNRADTFTSYEVLNLVEAYKQQEAVAAQARAEGWRAATEAAAKWHDEQAAKLREESEATKLKRGFADYERLNDAERHIAHAARLRALPLEPGAGHE